MKKGFSLLMAMTMVFVLAITVVVSGCSSNDVVTLNVLNWGDYIDEELIERFEEETGIDINYTFMANNEEMIVQLESPDCIYDLCFPSDYIIEKLIANNMLHELNMDNIPNIKNIDERFMDLSFDPDNKYSVPYMWGTVGILYNTKMVDDPVDSWDILWDEKYSQQILMYDSMRDSIGVALLKLGYDINTRDEAHIEAAKNALMEQKSLVRAYLGDIIKETMINNGGALAVVYSGDAMACMLENEDLAYAVPKEGSNLWFDNIIIPKTSKHAKEAEEFINFLCQADVAKQNTEYIGYSTPVKAALELMDAEWTEDETYNPPQDVIDRCDVFHDLGEFVTVYNDAWIQVNSYNPKK